MMKKAVKNSISFQEAMDVLASLAQTEFEQQASFADHDILHSQNFFVENLIEPFRKKDEETTEEVLEEIFYSVFAHLQNIFSEKNEPFLEEEEKNALEELMLIITEAASKIDEYTTFFANTEQESLTNTKTYKTLQEFYLKNIAKPLQKKSWGKWILELAKEKKAKMEKALDVAKKEKQKHFFVDLESGKKDTCYELFFMRKEDGSRFFNLNLMRNMRLVSEMEMQISQYKKQDKPFFYEVWQDLSFHEAAKDLLKGIGPQIDLFFEIAKKHQKNKIVTLSNSFLISLMMAANSKNLIENNPKKSCKEYFYDFQKFFRQALETETFAKWIVTPPLETNDFAALSFELLLRICYCFFMSLQGEKALSFKLHALIEKGRKLRSLEHMEEAEKEGMLWSYLALDYFALKHLFKRNVYAPLRNVFESFDKGKAAIWDPIMQNNLPSLFYELYLGEKRIVHARFPAPIQQQKVDKAVLDKEWYGFISSLSKDSHHHLMINLQDRTFWQEYARASLLEEEGEENPFLSVVTLAVHTDFYHQRFPYEQEGKAVHFMEECFQQLESEQSGFYFPENLKKKILPIIKDLNNTLFHFFFEGKNVLTLDNRKQFIDLLYLFLILKCMDVVEPSSFSLTCKDGIDIGPSFSALFYGFLKILQKQRATSSHLKSLQKILFIPPLLIRERIPLSHSFERCVNCLKLIEEKKQEMGFKSFSTLFRNGFSHYFENPVFDFFTNP